MASSSRQVVAGQTPPPLYRNLRKPHILLAASGCVAAVKFGHLCRSFLGWAEVKAVVTRAACHFVDGSSMPRDVGVYTDDVEWTSWKKMADPILHIELGRWADILVIAPLSANTLAKIAAGLCDNLLLSLMRAWDYEKPIFVAPAMNPVVWKNPLTERHIISLDEMGINLIPPVSVRLPGGEHGTGAMAEVDQIYSTIRFYWEKHCQRQARY